MNKWTNKKKKKNKKNKFSKINEWRDEDNSTKEMTNA